MVGQVQVNLGSLMPSLRPADGGTEPGLHGSASGVWVQTRGHVASTDAARAGDAVSDVLDRAGVRDGARVRLVGAVCNGGPTVVQVNLRVNGAAARIQVAGPSSLVAIGRAADRLQRQVRRLTTAYELWPWPDPQRRPLGVPGPGALRRRKRYRLPTGPPCRAIASMNAMDYDVMLYTDGETGEDAVVYRSGPTGVRLARQRSMRPPSMPISVPLTVNAHRVPVLTPLEATARLVHGWLPFVFFTDRRSGRGNLIYRRYDGDLGLVTPI